MHVRLIPFVFYDGIFLENIIFTFYFQWSHNNSMIDLYIQGRTDKLSIKKLS